MILMDTDIKNSNSGDEVMDTQTASPETTSGKAQEAMRQMAAATVTKAIAPLKASGITPMQIPWGKK
jgi:hypothetical protein